MTTITRKMAQIVKIDDVVAHHNADALEICKIRGWNVVSKIGNVDDILLFADGRSKLHDIAREGVVFKSIDSEYQFKAISNKWLIKSGE